MLSRRNFLASLAATPLIFGVTTPALAGEPEVYAINGIAINGYDPLLISPKTGRLKALQTTPACIKGRLGSFPRQTIRRYLMAIL